MTYALASKIQTFFTTRAVGVLEHKKQYFGQCRDKGCCWIRSRHVSTLSLGAELEYLMFGPKLVSFASFPPRTRWFPSISEVFLLFSGGLKDGLRHLRNSLKRSFQSAFSSDSSMRASTQSPLKGNTKARSAQGWTRLFPALLASVQRGVKPGTTLALSCLADVAL